MRLDEADKYAFPERVIRYSLGPYNSSGVGLLKFVS